VARRRQKRRELSQQVVQPGASFDDLVGAGENGGRDRQAERLRCLEVDHQFELGWLLDWEVGGFGAFQDAIDEKASRRIASKRFGP